MINRIESADSGMTANQAGGGGASPTSMLFLKGDWWVADVSMPIARNMIRQWHYAKGASNTRTYLHGLFPRDYFWESQAVGCAWWIPPTKTAAMSIDRNWSGVLALSRLVVSPDTPSNAESFLIRHSMRLIDRDRFPTLVTYADSWRGHLGTIYKASGWALDGETKPEKRYTIGGRLISRKAGHKTRTHQEMLDMGAECVGEFSCLRFVHRVQP